MAVEILEKSEFTPFSKVCELDGEEVVVVQTSENEVAKKVGLVFALKEKKYIGKRDVTNATPIENDISPIN
jgi:hypothetical protein